MVENVGPVSVVTSQKGNRSHTPPSSEYENEMNPYDTTVGAKRFCSKPLICPDKGGVYGWLLAFLCAIIVGITGACSPTSYGASKSKDISLYIDDSSGETCHYVRQTIFNGLFEGLVRKEKDEKLSLAMAESVKVSDDHRVYTFTIRPAQWSNGDPVTANDFVDEWNSEFASKKAVPEYFCMIEKSPSPSSNSSDKILSVKALDPKTIEITLCFPCPLFLEALADPSFHPRHHNQTAGDRSDDRFDGPYNGPFVMVKGATDHDFVLQKNPFYWDTNFPKADIIRFQHVETHEKAREGFSQGSFDWLGDPFSFLTNDDISAVSQGDIAGEKTCDEFLWLVCNINRPFLSSAKIRKALALSINRKALCQTLPDHPAPSLNISNDTIFTEPLLEDNATEKAKQLFLEGLRESGYTNETFPVLVLSDFPCDRSSLVAKTIREQLERTLGIRIAIISSTAFDEQKADLFLQSNKFYSFHHRIIPYLFLRTKFHSIAEYELTYKVLCEWDCNEPTELERLTESYAMQKLHAIPVYRKRCHYKRNKSVSEGVFYSDGAMDLKYLCKK